MISRTLPPVTVDQDENKVTVRVEIDNTRSVPLIRFYRKYSKTVDGKVAEASTTPIELELTSILTKSYTYNGKEVTVMDVYNFIRDLGDEVDPFTS